MIMKDIGNLRKGGDTLMKILRPSTPEVIEYQKQFLGNMFKK